MIRTLQRLFARIVAVTIVVAGAIVAVFVATFVAMSALALGIAAFVAGWIGTRSRSRRPVDSAPTSDRENGSGTVIDVEMREIGNSRKEDAPGKSGRA